MKNLKKLVAVVAAVFVLAAAVVVLAAEYKTPGEIVSDLVGEPVTKAEGQTYGEIARDYGVIDAFREEMLEQKKLIIDQRVLDGKLTQEQADEIYANIEEHVSSCDGTGVGSGGSSLGIGFGKAGDGNGNFRQQKDGEGLGQSKMNGNREGGMRQGRR